MFVAGEEIDLAFELCDPASRKQFDGSVVMAELTLSISARSWAIDGRTEMEELTVSSSAWICKMVGRILIAAVTVPTSACSCVYDGRTEMEELRLPIQLGAARLSGVCSWKR